MLFRFLPTFTSVSFVCFSLFAIFLTSTESTGVSSLYYPNRQISSQTLIERTRSSRPVNANPDFDCAWRTYAFEFSTQIQPWLTTNQLNDLYDALEIKAFNCNTSMLAPSLLAQVTNRDIASDEVIISRSTTFSPSTAAIVNKITTSTGTSFYVDYSQGSDTNNGSLQAPFKTIAYAVNISRTVPIDQKPVTLYLRNGTHYITSTINLTPQDNGLSFLAYNNEIPVLSGTLHLPPLTWTPYNKTNTTWSLVYNDTNNVYGQCGDSPQVPNMGIMNNWTDCQQSCFANSSCTGWTYHEGDYASFTHVCCWRLDGVWAPVSEVNISSQYLQPGLNIWQATLPANIIPKVILSNTGIPALHVNSHRATLARYPNANPELDLFPVGYITEGTWLPPVPSAVNNYTYTYYLDDMKDPAAGIYINYTVGIGGNADRYSPPESFWASSDFGPQSWMATSVDDRWVEMHLRSPSGLNYSGTLPKSPYKDLSNSIIHSWRLYHWYSWFFGVDSVNSNSTTFMFNRGGTQGGEGCDVAAEWFIDGVLEELDAPNEYYYDPNTNILYFYPNITDTAPDGSPTGVSLDVPILSIFFNLYGSQEFPIQNITFQGLTFTGGGNTFMEPHGVPASGDWAIERQGVLLLEGTENVNIIQSTFTRIDGNAIFLAGYNRYAYIHQNICNLLGQNCIASWGDSNYWDGTGGQQPRRNIITGNIAYDIGIIQKQSSFYFQAVSAENIIASNIVYNIPRAAVNFNDGFGGNNTMANNLLFNTCRESSDHSAFNSWARQPYVTLVRDGITPSAIPGYNQMYHNFIVGNYAADGGCFDNDDGSSFYNLTENFGCYCGSKSDFDGHGKISSSNIHVYPQVYGPRCYQIGAQYLPGALGKGGEPFVAGFMDSYFNNTCILENPNESVVALDVGDNPLPPPEEFLQRLYLGSNRIYAPNGQAGYEGPNGFKSYQDFQNAGYDINSTIINDIPTSATIIGWAKQLLSSAGPWENQYK